MHMRGRLKGKLPSLFTQFSPHFPLISWSQRGQGGGNHLHQVLLRVGNNVGFIFTSAFVRSLRVEKHCMPWEAADIWVTARWCWCELEQWLIGLRFRFALVAHWWLQLRCRSQVLNVTGHTIHPHWLRADHFSDMSGSISCHVLAARFFNPDDIPLLNPLSSNFPFGQQVGFYAPHLDMVPVQCVSWRGGRWNVILWGDVVPADCLRHYTVLPGCDGLDGSVVLLDDPVSARHQNRRHTSQLSANFLNCSLVNAVPLSVSISVRVLRSRKTLSNMHYNMPCAWGFGCTWCLQALSAYTHSLWVALCSAAIWGGDWHCVFLPLPVSRTIPCYVA